VWNIVLIRVCSMCSVVYIDSIRYIRGWINGWNVVGMGFGRSIVSNKIRVFWEEFGKWSFDLDFGVSEW